MATTSKNKATPLTKTVAKPIKVAEKIPAPVKTALVKSPATKNPAPKVIAKGALKSQAPKPAPTPMPMPMPTLTSMPMPMPMPKITVLADAASSSIKPIKAKKIKLVRDSFTIPKPEYLILDNLKLRATDLKYPVKKSEILRAGIKALDAMTDANLLAALKAVPVLKSGRPSN